MANIGTISGYYISPGGADDYAEAATSVAARVIFPGGDIGTFTVLMWVSQRTDAGLAFWSCGGTNNDSITSYPSAGAPNGRSPNAVEVKDNNLETATVEYVLPDTTAWAFTAVTCDGTDVIAYGNGVETDTDTVAGTYTAQDAFTLFSSGFGSEGWIANVAIFNRVLTADEIGALYVAGEEHDLRTSSEGWEGEIPYVYWCEAPMSGRVLNFGYGGSCDLILNGNISTGAFQPDYEEFPLPYPAKILETITFLFGKESQDLGGVPVTHLLANYTAGDPYFYVKSTLGFPDSGTVRVNNRKFTYTSRTPQTFDGIGGDWTLYNLPKGAYVVSVTSDILPDDTVDGIPHRYDPGA